MRLVRITMALAVALLSCGCFRAYDGDVDGAPSLGFDALVRLRDATPEQCAGGGLVVEAGIDANRDAILGDDEVDTDPVALCAGLDGDDAAGRVIVTDPIAAGATCAAGGLALSLGVDEDADAALDADEIERTLTLCNGVTEAAGKAKVAVDALSPPSPCAAGGVSIKLGVDDGAGNFAGAFVEHVVCNGEQGAAGGDGADADRIVVDVSAVGADCDNGGQRVRVGVDRDGDGLLDDDEVTASESACNGAPGANGAGTPPAGIFEGAIGAPVTLPVTAADSVADSRFVPAQGSSFYAFTAVDATGDARYSVILDEVAADLDVALFDDAQLTNPIAITCGRESARRLACMTDFLAPGTPYFLRLTDVDNVAHALTVIVTLGARHRAELAPNTTLFSGTVRGGDASTYLFRPQDRVIHTVSVATVAADPALAPPSFAIDIHEGSINAPPILSCGAACGLLQLSNTVDYVIVVRELERAGAAFNLSIVRGDPNTGLISTEENVQTIPQVLNPSSSRGVYRAGVTGPHTLQTSNGQVFTFADPARESAAELCGTGCVRDLEAGELLYVRAAATNVQIKVVPRAGDEDVQLAVGTPHLGSIGSASVYRLTAPPTGPTRFRMRISDLALGGVSCQPFSDAALTQTFYGTRFSVQVNDCITEPVPPGETVFVRISPSAFQSVHRTYTIDVEAGDTRANVITSGFDGNLSATTNTALEGIESAIRRIDGLSAPHHVVMTRVSGNLIRQLMPGDPDNMQQSSRVACATNATFCTTLAMNVPGEDLYLRVAPTAGTGTARVRLVPATIAPLTPGVAQATAALNPNVDIRDASFSFTTATDGPIRVTVTNSGAASTTYLCDLRDANLVPLAGGVEVLALQPGQSHTHTFGVLSPFAAGDYVVRVENVGSSTTFTVLVE